MVKKNEHVFGLNLTEIANLNEIQKGNGRSFHLTTNKTLWDGYSGIYGSGTLRGGTDTT